MLYQPEAKLVGNRAFSCETQLSDLEYADEMTLVAASWEDLKELEPEPITLHPNSDPIEVVSSFEYLGSTMSDDCSLTAEVEARISKAFKAFSSLSSVLWYQHKVK